MLVTIYSDLQNFTEHFVILKKKKKSVLKKNDMN